MTPSTWREAASGSLTGSTGAQSTRMKSAPAFLICSRTVPNMSEPSSTAGSCGSGPDGRTNMLRPLGQRDRLEARRQVTIAEHRRGEALGGLLDAEQLAEHRTPQVGRHDHDPQAVLGEDGGEVGGDGGLALAARRAGDEDGALLLAEAREAQARGQRPVRLRRRRRRRDERPLRRVELAARATGGAVHRDGAEERDAARGPEDLVGGLDPVVELLEEEDQADGEDERDHRRDAGVAQRRRRVGVHREVGGLLDPDPVALDAGLEVRVLGLERPARSGGPARPAAFWRSTSVPAAFGLAATSAWMASTSSPRASAWFWSSSAWSVKLLTSWVLRRLS